MKDICKGVCRNCSNPLLAEHAEQKKKAREKLAEANEKLDSRPLVERLNLKETEKSAQLKKSRDFLAYYLGRLDEWAPDKVINAADHCTGPLERTNQEDDGRTWRTQVCGAEAIAKGLSFCGYLVESAPTLDDDSAA